MPYEELLGWMSYFDERPVGWREDLATYRFLQSQGTKEAPEKIFPSLVPIFNKNKTGDMSQKLQGSMMLSKMMGAKGGKQIPNE